MIKKYLELCTSHLTEETVNSLNTVQPPYSYQYPYGVLLSFRIEAAKRSSRIFSKPSQMICKLC